MIKDFSDKHPDYFFITSGNADDIQQTILPIKQILRQKYDLADKLRCVPTTGWEQAFNVIASCCLYAGNDCGSCHVAASFHIPCVVLYNMEYSIIKNHPWATKWIGLENWRNKVSTQDAIQAMETLIFNLTQRIRKENEFIS